MNEKKFTVGRMAIVLVLAAAIRAGFVLWALTDWHASQQSGMSRLYFREAYAICAGYGYVVGQGKSNAFLKDIQRRVETEGLQVTPETSGELPEGWRYEMLHPPGYALLIAASHKFLGSPGRVPMQVLGVILDTVAACLMYWMVATFFKPRVGFISGILYAIYLPAAFMAASSMMPAGLLSSLVMACLACTLLAGRAKGGKAVFWFIAAGVLLGLGSYLRPDYMLMPVVLSVGLWAYTQKFYKSIGGMILTQLVVITVLFPWAYRNHQISGRWIFTSTSVGGTLITGLGEFENPWGFGGSDTDRHQEAIAQGFDSAWGSDADKHFRKVWLDSVKSDPKGYAMTIVRRSPMAVAPMYGFGFENPLKTQSFSETRQEGLDRYDAIKSRPLYILGAYWDRLAMASLSFLCLLCSMLMFIRQQRQMGLVFLLLCPHIYSIGSHILTHLEPRFLLPSMFSLLIGISYVLARGWNDNQLPAKVSVLEVEAH
jgi:4-amino-4-deoxy-L-arabinose transferase-like glycosyltransferase